MSIFSKNNNNYITYVFISDPRRKSKRNSLTEIRNDIKDLKRLMIIMANNQEEFDTKMQEVSELMGQLIDKNNRLIEVIEAEAAQVEEFIKTVPKKIDTSALDRVITEARAVVEESAGLEERVAGIFSTGEQTQTVTENGVTTEVPVDENGAPVGSEDTPGMTEAADDGEASGTEDDETISEGTVSEGSTTGGTEVADTAAPTGGEETMPMTETGQDAERTVGGENGTVGNAEGEGNGSGVGPGPIGGTGGGTTGSGGGTTGTTGV